MCAPGVRIKLCTCNLTEIDQLNCWQLNRGADRIEVMGSFMPPEGGFIDFNKKGFIKQKIIDDLNDGEVFDFTYNPVSGDTLKIWIEGEEYHFICLAGEFYDAAGERFQSEGQIKNFGSIKMTNLW